MSHLLTTINICKEALKFSGAHFTIFSATDRERLHGHNFRVRAEVTAPHERELRRNAARPKPRDGCSLVESLGREAIPNAPCVTEPWGRNASRILSREGRQLRTRHVVLTNLGQEREPEARRAAARRPLVQRVARRERELEKQRDHSDAVVPSES